MGTNTSTKPEGIRFLRHSLSLAILLPALLIIGCVSIVTDDEHGEGADDENQKHSFVVGENPTIDVTGFNGAITITTGEDKEVNVEATLQIPNRVFYSATVSGNTVTIVAKKTGSGFSIGRSPSATIDLDVPAESTIIAHTSNGRINVDGVTGNGTLDSSNGTITITDSDGSYASTTSNGSVKMIDVTGQFSAETSNGKIEFSGSFDENSDNNFKSSNGSIKVTFEDDPNLELDARTSNGTVESEIPILVTTTEKGHIVGKYGDGSAELRIRTSNGSIDIR